MKLRRSPSAFVVRFGFQDARANAEVEDPVVIANRERHFEWYDNWLAENQNPNRRYYWNRLADFVGTTFQDRYPPKEAGAIIRSIDLASDAVLRQMESPDPSRRSFQSKGLVVGYVQSGKTANFTAVVAKALDAGYRLVVILTGIHENLRRQTQQRLDCELTGEPDQPDLNHVATHGVTHRQIRRITTRDFDFTPARADSLSVSAEYPNPMLAVMKKNGICMRRFINWARRASDEERFSLPLLLIDDESDLASIDTNYRRGFDPTPTNECIRTILSLFPRNAYIGYTATPFANVLIDLGTIHEELGRDLYPRNFIVSLPLPQDYFGAERVFARGRDSLYVRIVPDNELPTLVPTSRNLHTIPCGVTGSLEQAVFSFILAGAARIERKQGQEPMTMLVHTTHRQAGHRRMREVLDEFCRSLRARLRDSYEKAGVLDRLRGIWESDFCTTTASLANEFPGLECSFGKVSRHIIDFLEQVQVLELNSRSEDELDYTEHRDLKVIAVGGNQLSRGLTLEGLTISFYLRKTGAYDTLLQMGRWFGYRRGYEDLTRVYTSHELAGWFEDLALVEKELRDDVSRYEDEGLTPADVSVRIRAHRILRVTARNKMGRGQVVRGAFSGRLAQTIWFPLNQPDVLRRNLATGAAFVQDLSTSLEAEAREGAHVLRGVPHEGVLQFLSDYTFDKQRGEAGPSLDSDDMIAYIRRQIKSGELLE